MIFAFFFSKIFWLLSKKKSPVAPPCPRFFRPNDWSEAQVLLGQAELPSMATLGPLADLSKLDLHLHVQLCMF